MLVPNLTDFLIAISVLTPGVATIVAAIITLHVILCCAMSATSRPVHLLIM